MTQIGVAKFTLNSQTLFKYVELKRFIVQTFQKTDDKYRRKILKPSKNLSGKNLVKTS